jgi:signal peptidase I
LICVESGEVCMSMCELRYVKVKMIIPIIKQVLTEGNRTRITVTGLSMYPFLREFIDSVELSTSTFEHIRYGDIVLIERKTGEYVLHRVLKKDKDCFYMVGDAQQWIEGPLYPDQLIAVVTAVYRKDKRIECSNLWWRLLCLTWLKLLPFRHLFIRAYRLLRKICTIHKKLHKGVRT